VSLKKTVLSFLLLIFSLSAFAKNKIVNLNIAYKTVNFAGKNVKAIAINNQIPGPVLHFKEGDHVVINVHNHLDEGTAVHWHGLLVPWQMDGVAGLSQAPIPPGGTFHYTFTLKQSGTYWYHAHFGLQEQQGLYGAIIIDPPHERYHYTKDFVALLSDWSNTNPEQIFRNLKKDGDYYAPHLPLQSSLSDFIVNMKNAKNSQEKQAIWGAYKMSESMRMNLYDISDVAYDTFLLNGHPASAPWKVLVKKGDVVRLRFINAGGSTFFHIKIPGTHMKVIHVQGNDITPYEVNDLQIAPAETYDVLIRILKNSPYIIYAESTDKVGKVYGALLTSPTQSINIKNVSPFPAPSPQDMMTNMGDMGGMDMSMMNMDMDDTQGNAYRDLVSPFKTNNPHKSYEVIHLKLMGYMDRYEWFINGLPESKAKPIIITPGKRYRIIFENDTMMHHPMHLHGHWFILRNGHGAYDPLLHTIDVGPFETVTADFDANESGQWYSHCHNAFHMMAGMARVFRYANFTPPDTTHYHHAMGFNLLTANDLEIGIDPFNNLQEISFKSLIGSDDHKLQINIQNAEIEQHEIESANMDVFYWHPVSEFWAIKGGLNYVYRPGTPYFQPGIGIEGMMPWFIRTDFRTYLHAGSVKGDLLLSRDNQITRNFFIQTGIESIFATQQIPNAAINSGLNEIQYTLKPFYRVMPGVALFLQYEHTDYFGYAKAIQGSGTDNTFTGGVELIF